MSLKTGKVESDTATTETEPTGRRGRGALQLRGGTGGGGKTSGGAEAAGSK